MDGQNGKKNRIGQKRDMKQTQEEKKKRHKMGKGKNEEQINIEQENEKKRRRRVEIGVKKKMPRKGIERRKIEELTRECERFSMV